MNEKDFIAAESNLNFFPMPSQVLKENGSEIKDIVMTLPEPTIQARKQRKFTLFWPKKRIEEKPVEVAAKPSVEIVSI